MVEVGSAELVVWEPCDLEAPEVFLVEGLAECIGKISAASNKHTGG